MTGDKFENAIVVVAGPTASGKSALALDLALHLGGTILNADSMQVYSEISLLTARPCAVDLARAPHRLYGVLPGHDVCSAGRWLYMAATEIQAARAKGSLPIVVGGTGLYLKALLEGLSPIPPIPAPVRKAARQLMEDIGNAAFHSRLAEVDPVMAERLATGNTQRLVRAWEVLEATGRSLAEWQADPPQPLVRGRFLTLLVAPPRDQVGDSCNRRFDEMMLCGALDEARTLLSLNLPKDAPVMKALGVPELTAHLRGALPLAEAVEQAKLATRQFAKRQMTWFRGQLQADHTIPTKYSESLRREIFSIVREFLLTPVA